MILRFISKRFILLCKLFVYYFYSSFNNFRLVSMPNELVLNWLIFFFKLELFLLIFLRFFVKICMLISFKLLIIIWIMKQLILINQMLYNISFVIIIIHLKSLLFSFNIFTHKRKCVNLYIEINCVQILFLSYNLGITPVENCINSASISSSNVGLLTILLVSSSFFAFYLNRFFWFSFFLILGRLIFFFIIAFISWIKSIHESISVTSCYFVILTLYYPRDVLGLFDDLLLKYISDMF